jgi:hypothetical protein
MLADWHVPATENAAKRLQGFGVPRERILAIGCPSSDGHVTERFMEAYPREVLGADETRNYPPKLVTAGVMTPVQGRYQSPSVGNTLILVTPTCFRSSSTSKKI